MADNGEKAEPSAGGIPGQQDRVLTPEARRALAEADARRQLARQSQATPEPETGGREGPEPTRYGDWEKGGIVSDF